MISLIIPALYANKELMEMTQRCIDSIGFFNGEIILQVDEDGSGYSYTTNRALERADGSILVVGNNDLIFHENWLVELLFPISLGCDIATVWTSDQDNIVLEDRIEYDAKFGSLFAMTRSVYETLGGFDEQFKGCFTDTDFRRRALDNGFRIGKNLSSVVHHEAKATYKVTDPDDNEFLKAQMLYEIKHGFLE